MLEDGERIVWADRPSPLAWIKTSYWVSLIAGLVVFVVIGKLLYDDWRLVQSVSNTGFGHVVGMGAEQRKVFVLVLALSLFIISLTPWQYRIGAAQRYYLTDRRLIIASRFTLSRQMYAATILPEQQPYVELNRKTGSIGVLTFNGNPNNTFLITLSGLARESLALALAHIRAIKWPVDDSHDEFNEGEIGNVPIKYQA